MIAIIYEPKAGEAAREQQQIVLCALAWVCPGTGPWLEIAWGNLLVVALAPFVNGSEAPDWYVGLRQALGLDTLPELVPFAIKDFRITWHFFS